MWKSAGVGTYTLGYSTISFFKPKFGDKEMFDFIKNREKSFNSVINLFKTYSEKFKMNEKLNVNEDEIDMKDDYIFTLHE